MHKAIFEEPVELHLPSSKYDGKSHYYLRSPTKDDGGPDLQTIHSMSDIGRTEDDTSFGEFFDYIVKGPEPGHARLALLLILNNGKCIGWTGFSKIWSDTAEITVRVHPEHAGKGIGTAAVLFCIKHGFAKLGFDKIFIDTSPQNTVMERMMTKLGRLRRQEVEVDGERTVRYWVQKSCWSIEQEPSL